MHITLLLSSTVESRFLESPRETKSGSRNRRKWEFEKSKVASSDTKKVMHPGGSVVVYAGPDMSIKIDHQKRCR